MTHMVYPQSQGDPYEKCSIQYHLPSAMIWQIKFILSSVNSKKSLATAAQEFSHLSDGFGKEFDKYLLRELIEAIEIKDSKNTRDKSDQFKIQLLNQELIRASQKPEFLSYFCDIIHCVYGFDNLQTKPDKFFSDMKKRLNFNFQVEILVSLSLIESMTDPDLQLELLVILKNQLIDFHANGKFEQLPEYAVHRILYLFDTIPCLSSDLALRDPKQQLIATMQDRFSQFTPLRCSLHQDATQLNCHSDQPSYNMFIEGCGLDFLMDIGEILQPWEILIDIGHNSSYMYDFLVKTLSEFKSMDDQTMALTLLHLAINHTGKDDHISKIVYNTYESNREGNPNSLNKEPEDKKTQMTWSLDNLARAFRELYPNVNWGRVFESFGELIDQDLPETVLEVGLDQKQFQTLLQLYNKCKPTNISYPLQNLLTANWKSPSLHLSFIKNSILTYVAKKEKQINFNKLKNRVSIISELQEIKERGESLETIEVWQSVDLVEKLVNLSEEPEMYLKIRRVFEHPLRQLPEYLLLAISLGKFKKGNVMIDELLSILLPIFLGNHVNSSVVLQKLFDYNKELFIRGICELCKHDQRLMNLSRVLDITQEVRESLLAIVYCHDYDFAVNLGILAGKRDFLHYDKWIQGQIKDVGSPFIDAVVKYISEHILSPVTEFVRRNQVMQETSLDNFEAQKNAILERSHLCKEKLQLTIQHLQNSNLRQPEKVKAETLTKISEVVKRTNEIFPQHFESAQHSEEIEEGANENFQQVFKAETDEEVDLRIEELVQKMQEYKQSEVRREQEIFACMLHSLFDEYRFLHRYPQEYLTKIAKLYGAIIKNNLLETPLQDIALKFVTEAFRRDGRRQRFGVIAIKSFKDILPKTPDFLADIYEIRECIKNTEPELMHQIEKLHLQVQQDIRMRIEGGEPTETTEVTTTQTQQTESQEDNFDGSKSQDYMGQEKQKRGQDQKGKDKSKNQQQSQQQNQQKQQQKGKRQQSQQQQQTGKTQTLMVNPNAIPSFIPQCDVGNIQLQMPNQSAMPMQTFQMQQQPSQLVDHLKMGGPDMTKMSQNKLEGGILEKGLNCDAEDFNPQPENIMKGPEFTIPGQFSAHQGLSTAMIKVFDPNQTNELQQIKERLEEKMKQAIQSKSKVKLADILEDNTLEVDEIFEDRIRIIFNQIDKNNFKNKIEDVKKLISTKDETTQKITVSGKNLVNIKWFIQTILIRRIGQTSTTLFPIYLDIIKELHNSIHDIEEFHNVMGITQWQVALLLKKCFAINEDSLMEVMGQQSGSPLKGYVESLGCFLGSLTLKKGLPILRRYIDMKQILIEGYCGRGLRLAVIFVCRVLQETKNSKVFSSQNPWIKSLMGLLKDIVDSPKFDKSSNLQHEIDLLKDKIGPMINQYGIIKLLENSTSLGDTVIKQELEYIIKKKKMILPIQEVDQREQDKTTLQAALAEETIEQLEESIQNIDAEVQISESVLNYLNQFPKFSQEALKKIVGRAVDNSIVEILPPVVNRSVTIALITTNELVLKDFAFDGDSNRVLQAADLMVQNFAGSLALVTCKEPLRVSLLKQLQQLFEEYCGQGLNLKIEERTDEQQDTFSIAPRKITDICTQLGKDNLELGCELIKSQVISKALKQVREDPKIKNAINERQQFQETQGRAQYRDQAFMSQLNGLPSQLLPSSEGLTPPQFQVYLDFAALSGTSFVDSEHTDLGSLFRAIDKHGLVEPHKTHFIQMIKSLTLKSSTEDKELVWNYAQKNMEAICKNFDSQNSTKVEIFIEILSNIIHYYKVEDLSKRLLQEVLLKLDRHFSMVVGLNMLLLKRGIIPHQHWDIEMAPLVHLEKQFFLSFLPSAIVEQKILYKENLPQIFSTIERMSSDPAHSQFCNEVLGAVEGGSDFKNLQDRGQKNLRDLFLRWVVISYHDNKSVKEQLMNQFYKDLDMMGIGSDDNLLMNFCRVMVHTSIEHAQYVDSECTQSRFPDRLDFRYIDSFVWLILVLVKMLNLSVHQFISSILDIVQEALAEDHKKKKAEFNQRPYYRFFIQILAAIDRHQEIFSDKKVKKMIMISIAEIFKNLSPSTYPAFSFAWLELISHYLFLPYFLETPANSQNVPPLMLSSNQQKVPFDSNFLDKRHRMMELIGNIFYFLKNNMIKGEPAPPAIQAFYHATLRVIHMISQDYPDFLSDFHFNFVNKMPDHCIQLRNMVLAACPKGIEQPEPFHQELKVDLLPQIDQEPRILSNFENYLSIQGLKDALDQYNPQRSSPQLIIEICRKMEQNEESLNGRKRVLSNLISAVVLYLAQQSNSTTDQRPRSSRELFKQIAQRLNDETRMCFFNAIVNELRFPSKHTFAFSCTILYIYAESGNEKICEQISQIFLERLQAEGPHPWGLLISFRELIQNQKLEFMGKSYIKAHQQAIAVLFMGKLRKFVDFLPAQIIQQFPLLAQALQNEQQ